MPSLHQLSCQDQHPHKTNALHTDSISTNNICTNWCRLHLLPLPQHSINTNNICTNSAVPALMFHHLLPPWERKQTRIFRLLLLRWPFFIAFSCHSCLSSRVFWIQSQKTTVLYSMIDFFPQKRTRWNYGICLFKRRKGCWPGDWRMTRPTRTPTHAHSLNS